MDESLELGRFGTIWTPDGDVNFPVNAPTPSGPEVVVVSVGNSRVKFAKARGEELDDSRAIGKDDVQDAVAAIVELAKPDGRPVVMASVNNAVADVIEKGVVAGGVEVYRLGRDLQVPINHALDDASTVGQDRLLNAFGAYARSKQACIVIDTGTAITVDFVDGEGTFQGGMIAPGLRAMLGAMHSSTAALPRLDFAPPDTARGVFGKDTAHAMLLGVQAAVRGIVRYAVDTYAEAYGGYPRVIATGGDARRLLENEPVVENIVSDLQLIGLAAVCNAVLDGGDDEGDDA